MRNKRERKKNRIISMFAIVLIITSIGLLFIPDIIKKNAKFELKDDNYYIIDKCGVFLYKTDDKEYYEIDFNKNNIINRKDANGKNGIFIHEVKKDDYSELKAFIEKIISDKKSQEELTEEAEHILYRQGLEKYYEIKTYDNKTYYVKDKNDIKQMEELLK